MTRLLLVCALAAATGCQDKGKQEPAAAPVMDAAPVRPDAAPAPAAADVFAPLRRVGAEWRYRALVRRDGALEPVPGVAVVVRVAEVDARGDHAFVTLASRLEPATAAAPPELVRWLEHPSRFILVADGLVESWGEPELRADQATAWLAAHQTQDAALMLPARFVNGWRIEFANKDANGEARLARSRRRAGGADVELWTLAWKQEYAVPPLRKRPWRWRPVRYQIEYSPEIGFVALATPGGELVLALAD